MDDTQVVPEGFHGVVAAIVVSERDLLASLSKPEALRDLIDARCEVARATARNIVEHRYGIVLPEPKP